MWGSFRHGKQSKRAVKAGRAVLLALGTFTRSFGGYASYALILGAACIRSAPFESWRRQGRFLRRGRISKCVRFVMFAAILVSSELYVRYIFGLREDVFGLSILRVLSDISAFDVVFNVARWTWSTLVQSLCLICFGACAVPIEVTVIALVLIRFQAAFPQAYNQYLRIISVTGVVIGLSLMWLNHAVSYHGIQYTTISAPGSRGYRVVLSTVWLHACILFGGYCQMCRLCMYGRPGVQMPATTVEAFVLRHVGNWSGNVRVAIATSRALQRALFISYARLLRYRHGDNNLCGNIADTHSQENTFHKVLRRSTSMAIGALQKNVVPDLSRLPSIAHLRAPREWDDPAFRGFTDDQLRCWVRGDSNAVFALALTSSGIFFGSWKALVVGPSFGVLGLLLRLLPVPASITHVAADHLIHIGSLSFGLMQLFALAMAFCLEALLKYALSRSSKSKEDRQPPSSELATSERSAEVGTALARAVDGNKIAVSREDPRVRAFDDMVSAALGLQHNTNHQPSTKRNQQHSASAVLRSKSAPIDGEQVHLRSAVRRGDIEAESAPTRQCCVCYEEVSSLRGVLCRRDEAQSLRRNLPVHFTCDACLERHVETEFPLDTPSCAALNRLGRGDGGLYCPCHPGKPTVIIRTPSGGGVGAGGLGGESKRSSSDSDVSCSAPAFDTSLLASHLSRSAFQRCLAIRRYVGEQRIFEDTTAKWQERYNRALQQIKAQKIREDRSILAEQLMRQFPDARQCKECGHGPILHFACADLMAHHGEQVKGGGSINNACVKCGWFGKRLNEWPKWNGQLGEELDVSNVDAKTVAAAAAAAIEAESASIPSGRLDTELQRAARRARLAAVAARRAALSAQTALSVLRGGSDAATGTSQIRSLALTHDLRRMVDEGTLTEEQAQGMMPAPEPLRPAPSAAVAAGAEGGSKSADVPRNEEEAVRNAAQLNLRAVQLERAARLAQQAATREAEAFAVGDDGSLKVFVFPRGRSTLEEEAAEQKMEQKMEGGDEEGHKLPPTRGDSQEDLTSGAYEMSLLCAFGLSLICTCGVSFVCRSGLRWGLQLAWGFVFTPPNLGQVFFTLVAGAAGLIGYAQREAIHRQAQHVYSLFLPETDREAQ